MTETIQFEAVKNSLRQTKDGYSLTLSLHPDDIPDHLIRDFVGARYMVVMVRLNDDETPMVRPTPVPDKAMACFGLLTRDPQFYRWVKHTHADDLEKESDAIEWLKFYLCIESRSALKTDERARDSLMELFKEFKKWTKDEG